MAPRQRTLSLHGRLLMLAALPGCERYEADRWESCVQEVRDQLEMGPRVTSSSWLGLKTIVNLDSSWSASGMCSVALWYCRNPRAFMLKVTWLGAIPRLSASFSNIIIS